MKTTDSDILAEVRRHLMGMAPHIKRRKTPQLLLELVGEVERLRAELDAERHEQKCFEASFLNVCLYAEIDPGQSREVMEEELVSLVKAAKAAGGNKT